MGKNALTDLPQAIEKGDHSVGLGDGIVRQSAKDYIAGEVSHVDRSFVLNFN